MRRLSRLFRRAVRSRTPVRIGLALGGGFARAIAHIGVLRVFEENEIPIHAVAGVSAGAIIASAYASGASVAEIEAAGRAMKFGNVARWTINRLGLAGSDRMVPFLSHLLKSNRFEDMRIPLAVVATDLATGKPVVFRDQGEVVTPIRASCSFPGLFLPVRHENRCLIDGFVGMAVPAKPLRSMGCSHVVSIAIPVAKGSDCTNIFSVIDRCFQVMADRLEPEWRRHSDVVIEPNVCHIPWDGFASAGELIAAGEEAARPAVEVVRRWLETQRSRITRRPSTRYFAESTQLTASL